MNISKLDTLEQINIYKVPGLTEFLCNRPDDEDLGESLDLFLKQSSQISENIEKTIRAIHLKHQSNIFINNPICSVSLQQDDEDALLKEFCSNLDDAILAYSTEKIDELMYRYADSNNLYLNMEVVEHLLRIKNFEKAYSVFQKQINGLFTYSVSNWNKKVIAYGAAMLAFRMVSNFNISDLQNNLLRPILGNAIEITYLLLTHVICWPEESEVAKRSVVDLPISYEHRIGALLKRIELLDNFSNYFSEMVPLLSTVDTLIVSDYYFAHELSFALQTLGRKSEFKRDARDKYRSLDTTKVRPFSTCISDGKKDSLELAYRFYLKYSANMYMLDDQQEKTLHDCLKNRFSLVSEEQQIKADKNLILNFFRQNDINCFYHFTEKANLANIRKNGGLFSQRECLAHSIVPRTSADMRHLRSKDSSFYLEDYVRLSFCKKHPLTDQRKGELVLLKIKVDIALLDSTLFSDRDAALDSHQRGGKYEDLKKIHLNAIREIVISKDDPEYVFSQAEIMVKSYIPREYIINLDNPETI